MELHDGHDTSEQDYGEARVDNEASYELGFEDVALVGTTAVLAICCEPAFGSVRAFRWGSFGHMPVAADSAVRVDLHDGLMARRDGGGFAALRPGWLDNGGGFISVDVGTAYDVALVPGGPAPVVALVDGEGATGWVLVVSSLDGKPVDTLPLDVGAVCGIVALEGGAVGVLAEQQPPQQACTADRLVAVNLADGSVIGEMSIPGGAVQANTDGSGRYLIYVTADGGIAWRDTAGDGAGDLAPAGNYQAVDW